MSRWWRAYDEAVDDPKVQLLEPSLFKSWFNLMCLASTNGGTLPTMEHIAFKLHVSKLKAELIVSALMAARLFDKRDDGEIEPHNWGGRQYQSDRDATAPQRSKRYRDKRSVTRDATVTSRVSHAVQSTETETEADKSSEVRTSAQSAIENLDVEVVGEDPKARLFRLGKPILISFGISEKRTGSLIGQWLKAKSDPLGILAALQFARNNNVAEPVAYVSAIIHGKAKDGVVNGSDRRPRESLGDFARRLAADARELEDSTHSGRAHEPFGSD